jgi:precorrin-6B methylase 2
MSENKSRSIQYQATKVRPFLKLLKRLELPEDSVFVDLGSGKGRVLLLASQCRFKRVVGIEFCANLCAQARENINVFRQHTPRASEIEVIESDVTRHTFKGDENVFYLYNPFDAIVLGKVLDNIERSLTERPRQIWLIYNTPVLHAVLEQTKLFSNKQVFKIGASEFSVYSNVSPSRSVGTNHMWTAIAMANSFAKTITFI